MATANVTKVTVVLNTGGQVAGASKHKAYTPGNGEEPEVSFGLVADLGQTLVEVEVPADVATLEGSEFLSHLTEHAAVKAALESSPAPLHANAAQGEAVSFGTV